MINCTYAGMRGGVMIALLPILAHDIPWSAGGLMRCFDLVSEEGTINNATFPAAVSRGPIGPAWLTGTLVAECLSQMLDRSVDLGKSVQAACCGTWDTAVIAGLDERGEVPVPFLNILMEPMAGGYGARPQADGMDTGGLFCIPMGRIPDTEMSEFLYPMLVLWRREETDSGGPGRMRGGVSASLAFTPTAPAFQWGWSWHRPAKPSHRTQACPAAIRETPASIWSCETWTSSRCSEEESFLKHWMSWRRNRDRPMLRTKRCQTGRSPLYALAGRRRLWRPAAPVTGSGRS